jgi:hypothetical protein
VSVRGGEAVVAEDGSRRDGTRERGRKERVKPYQNLFQLCSMPDLKFKPWSGSSLRVISKFPSAVVIASGSYL